jgi:hypothetical protein
MAFIAARMSVLRGCPPGLAAGICGPSRAHSPFRQIAGKLLALPIQNVAPVSLIKQKGNSVDIPVTGRPAPSSINSTS